MKTTNPAKTAFAVLDIEKALLKLRKTRRGWNKNRDKYLQEIIDDIKDKKIKANITENI